MIDISDEELYRRMKAGDKAALVELYERREPGLYRYALHMSGSRVVAEEVTHEVFFRLIGPGVKFDPRLGSLEAYLHGVARNLLRGIARIAQREPELTEVKAAAEHDLLKSLIDDEMTAALHLALQDLTPEYRDAVVLCDLEERSYEDAAKLMDCPIGTVRSRLHRARGLLASKLKRFKTAPGSRTVVA
ncbi:MAG TPA: RNA polymerase sigma factor [Bryobacteraceae bacterium]|nr:RNA polymerase sigma factor [Bryobacteraceae bacterium]